MRTLVNLLPILLCLSLCMPALAQEKKPAAQDKKPVKVKPSKVSAAKGREREKLFSDWHSQSDFQRVVNERKDGQLIFYEYHEGKDAYRGIFSKAIQFNGWWRATINGEKDMEKEVNSYKTQGYEPLFVVLDRNYYQMIFVRPEQLEAARKLILDLGVEPPVLK